MNNNSVWHRVSLPSAKLYAQAAVTDEEVNQLRELPLTDVRAISSKQIERARDFFKDVAGWNTWLDANLPQYVHWKPYKEIVDNAEVNFQLGEREGDADRKKEYYILAWRTSRVAIDKIAEEKKQNPSDFLVFVDPVTKPIADTYRQAKTAIDDVKRKTEETASTLLKVGIGLGILYVIISASRK